MQNLKARILSTVKEIMPPEVQYEVRRINRLTAHTYEITLTDTKHPYTYHIILRLEEAEEKSYTLLKYEWEEKKVV